MSKELAVMGKITGKNQGMGVIGTVKTKAVLLLTAAITLLAVTAASGHDVLFLGVTDKRGESAHAQLETEIRHYLASNQRLRLRSEVETQRVIREIERTGRNRTEPFIPSSAMLPDSTIIIRGVVEELSFTPKRRMLALGRIDARLKLMIYFNKPGEAVMYQGEFEAAARKNEGVLLFANPQKTIHVSATDRLELTRELHGDIVKKVSDFSKTFFSSLETGPVHKRAAEAEAAAAAAENGGDGENETPSADVQEIGEDDFPGAGELMTE